MQFLALVAGLAATLVAAQDAGSPPPGCVQTYSQPFQITTLNATGFVQPALLKRQTSASGGSLVITLANGQLTDTRDGTPGYIASNQQFQFGELQPNNLQTSPFSICPNNTLALGGTTIWYSCPSGSFSNLYDQSIGAQCSQVFISIMPQGGASTTIAPAPTTSAASVQSDGQPTAATTASSASSAVTQISDNQPQAATSAATAVTQISDNQPQAATQAPSATPVYNNGAASNGLSQMALAGALALFVL